jgi:hypothetical protein
MTWFAVDDSFHAHPKVADLEGGRHFAEAVALWALAGSWCASQLTDGRVPAHQLRRLAPFKAREAAAELVRVGLWDPCDDGYQFRDWDDYQPSKDEVEAKRRKAAKRSRKYRDKFKLEHDVTRDVTRDATRDFGVSDAPPVPTPSTPNGVLVAAPPPDPLAAACDPSASRAIDAYRDGIGSVVGKRPPVNHASRFGQASELWASLDGTEAERLDTIRRAAAVAARDDEHRKANVPFAWFARNVGKYSTQADTPSKSAAASELSRLVREEQAARLAYRHDEAEQLYRQAQRIRSQMAGAS